MSGSRQSVRDLIGIHNCDAKFLENCGHAAFAAANAARLSKRAVFSVLAGSLRMPWVLFLGAGLVGRFGRFLAVLLAPGLLPDGLH